ncbi:MAG TPA: hypothetical protein VHY08_05350 [Bacillota bacterium]|nr:hypothetical protein [Bacillota bacterium]
MGVQSDGKTGKNPRESKWLKVVGVALVVMAIFLIYKTSITQAETAKNGDLRILKKEVTSKAKFYPVTVNGVKMEVIAVKASDGSVRTAFNTC